jgi:signal transduction histidine kinase
VTDLRDLSIAQAGQLRLNMEPAIINDVIQAELSALLVSADEHEVALHAAADADLPQVLVDVQRVRQVLRNLITNALRYTPPGGSITVSAELQETNKESSQRFVRVSVTDTGSGIAPEDLPSMFTHFYKADHSRHRTGAGSGSGLGLAIVKQLVELHGGTVGVKSEQGKGACFYFTLPVSQSTVVEKD